MGLNQKRYGWLYTPLFNILEHIKKLKARSNYAFVEELSSQAAILANKSSIAIGGGSTEFIHDGTNT